MGDHQYTVNEFGYEMLKELTVQAIETVDSKGIKSWDFLTNGKLNLKKSL